MSSIQITINGQVIDLPASSASPNWAEAIIQAFQATADALTSVVGPFDIAPQAYSMVSNSNSNVNVPGLTFPTSNVRSAIIRYSVHRTTNSTEVDETGTLQIIYNPTNSSTQKWEMTREYTEDAQVTFIITDTGQVQFSSTAISGTGHAGIISFAAQALIQ